MSRKIGDVEKSLLLHTVGMLGGSVGMIAFGSPDDGENAAAIKAAMGRLIEGIHACHITRSETAQDARTALVKVLDLCKAELLKGTG